MPIAELEDSKLDASISSQSKMHKMKKVKIEKSLSLKKATVASLEDDQMAAVKGGFGFRLPKTVGFCGFTKEICNTVVICQDPRDGGAKGGA